MSTFLPLIESNHKPELSSLRNPQLIDKIQTVRIATKSKGAAALAFQMVHQATQRNVLPPAARTVVDILPMDRTSKMLIQRGQSTEAILAEVAAVPVAIPSRIGGQRCRGGVIVVPADLLVCEDVIGVNFPTVLVNLLAVDAGGASAGFEMKADASQVREHVGTPRAFGIFANMDRGFQMLESDIYISVESALSRCKREVWIDVPGSGCGDC